MKMKTILSILVFLTLFLFNPSTVYSQKPTITLNSECGKVIQAEFTVKSERQDIKIFAEVGDVLDINIIPVGDYLKVWAELSDPADGEIIKEKPGMFGTNKKSLVLKTGILSSKGTYTLSLYNTISSKFNIGAYNVYIKCKKKNGDIIEPK